MLLWSIALPGFGQLLNKKYIIGIVLLLLEITVNIQSNLNEVIVLSFQGDISTAVEKTNYQWLMFYPCLYFFAMWDAFKDAKGETRSEEHTSELQSRENLVCRLLLEKKNQYYSQS